MHPEKVKPVVEGQQGEKLPCMRRAFGLISPEKTFSQIAAFDIRPWSECSRSF